MLKKSKALKQWQFSTKIPIPELNHWMTCSNEGGETLKRISLT